MDGDVAFIAMEALAFIVLFATALYFRSVTLTSKHDDAQDEAMVQFVTQKKDLACALAGVYVLVAMYSFTSWSMSTLDGDGDLSRTVFFLDFFTWLILSDIVVLLASYKHITDFTQLARNTGFVLSTVMIRVGIGTPGYTGASPVHSLRLAGRERLAVKPLRTVSRASRHWNEQCIIGPNRLTEISD